MPKIHSGLRYLTLSLLGLIVLRAEKANVNGILHFQLSSKMPKGKTGGDEGERELSETSAIIGVLFGKSR